MEPNFIRMKVPELKKYQCRKKLLDLSVKAHELAIILTLLLFRRLLN